VVNGLVVFGWWISTLAAQQLYTILIGWTLHDQLMIVSDWPNDAFAFENVEFYISYSGDNLELVHAPF